VSTLNLGILAHIDAGKTSLTERLLFAAGVIDEIGSVDDGNTQTDSLALERQRGITIKSAVVSFAIGDVTVNLIDTPGHPDFIAEVERVLSVLDGAVLVISAVEGVQAQTRVLMRALQRLRIPTLVFVNKIDRNGADYGRTLAAIARKLTPAIVPMGTVAHTGTKAAAFLPYGTGGEFAALAAEVLADHDDAFLAAYLDDEQAFPLSRLRAELAAQARRALVHPVYFGSAITGAGVDALTTGIRELLPRAGSDCGGPVGGTVFKVERGPAGEKIAYVRMFAGTVRTRERIRFGRTGEAKVTAISVFDQGTAVPRDRVTAGQIAKLWGLADVRIGDTLGQQNHGNGNGRHFSPPTLETVVVPTRRADSGLLHVALTQLAEQDPLINLRQDDVRQELLVSLYGEVQKEVVQATLAGDYGIDVGFRGTTTICIERPTGSGAAAELIATPSNPFLATVGLRITPAAPGSGISYQVASDRLGTMPAAFFKAVEETVHETLHQGLHGWQVTDINVTLTHTGYYPRQSHAHAHFDKSMSSTAGDFRNLTPLVLMTALAQAGTEVCEPVHRFRLEIPADAFGPVLPALTALRAIPAAPAMHGPVCLLEGEIPAASVRELELQLPGLTRGEGVLECTFGHYQPVRGQVPERPRSDHNPLNRKEYLLSLTRRTMARSGAG
jgi:ribosomal protection tetracycline resistance protein